MNNHQETWRLEITPNPPTDRAGMEAVVDNWAHFYRAARGAVVLPAIEAAPRSRYGPWDTYTVTAPGNRDAPPGWLDSLYDYVWRIGYSARLRMLAGEEANP